MELVARDPAGEALACALGCTREGQTVRAGLLYVRGGLAHRDHLFQHPQTETTFRLRLPEGAVGLPRAGQAINATLEVLP